LSRLSSARARAAAREADLERDLDRTMESARGSNADDEHDPEGATIGFERAQVTALLDQARRQLGDVDRALGRLRAGTYEMCESCGRPIGPARLEARPTAVMCVVCARQAAGARPEGVPCGGDDGTAVSDESQLARQSHPT